MAAESNQQAKCPQICPLTQLSSVICFPASHIKEKENEGEMCEEKSYMSQKLILIGLDSSGSMGDVFHMVRGQTYEFMDRELTDDIETSPKIILIPYSTNATSHEFRTCSELRSFRSRVALNYGGLTNFPSVLKLMSTSVKYEFDRLPQNTVLEVELLFLTDGCETVHSSFEKKPIVQRSMDELKNSLNIFAASSRVKTIGFTSSHDANFLGKLSEIGHQGGDFIYSKTQQELKTQLEISLNDHAGNAITASIRHNPTNQSFKCHIFDSIFYSLIPSKLNPFKLEENGEIQFEIHSMNEGKQRIFTSTFTVLPNHMIFADAIRAFLSIFPLVLPRILRGDETLFGFPREASALGPNASLLMLQQMDDELNSLYNLMQVVGTKNYSKETRKELLRIWHECKTIMTNCVRECTRAIESKTNISNNTLADLQHKSYEHARSSKGQKRLDNRKSQNVAKMSKFDERLQKTRNSINIETLSLAKNSNLDPCIMSMCDWKDCLEDGDCLCMALSIGRSEACAMDPAQLLIKEVLPSMISATNFLDSINFTTRGTVRDSSIHGGFSKTDSSSGFLSGVARDQITGVLVLFLHPENWKIARLHMEPVYSYMCCLDILHFTQSMSTIIPFLVLEYLLKQERDNLRTKQSSSFVESRLSLTLDTCSAIMNLYEENEHEKNSALEEKISNLIPNFVDDVLYRLPDSIESLEVALLQLFTLAHFDLSKHACDEEMWLNFYQLLQDEALRRSMKHRYKTGFSFGEKELKDYFGVNVQEILKPHMIAYEQDCLDALDKEEKLPSNPSLPGGISVQIIDFDLQSLQEFAKVLGCDKSSKSTKRITGILESIVTLTNYPIIPSEETVVSLARTIRAILYRNTADVRDAAPGGDRTFDIFDEVGACAYINNLATKVLYETFQKQAGAFATKLDSNKMERLGLKFVTTSDMAVAVKIASELNHGFNMRSFWTPFMEDKNTYPLAFEKIQFLLTGIYNEERQLYKNIKVDTWQPTKRNVHHLFRANFHRYPNLHSWKTLFVPNHTIVKETHFDVWHKINHLI